MQRIAICLLVALVWWSSKSTPNPSPNPAPPPGGGAVVGLEQFARSMTATDKAALRDAYEFMARGLEADPKDDPVFARVDQIRQGHRAALLMCWQAMGNNAQKYPGLGQKLEELLTQGIGDADLPLSPPVRQQAVQLFRNISRTFQ